MKKQWLPIGFAAAYLGIYFAINLIVSLIVIVGAMILRMASGIEVDPNNMMQFVGEYTTTILIISNTLAIVGIGLIYLGRKVKLREHIKLRKISLKDGLLATVFAVFLNLLFVAMVTFALETLPPNPFFEQFEALMETVMGGNMILVYVSVVIAAPLFEEFLCRGVILNDFKNTTKFWVANLIQAFVFGAIHMNLVQGVYAFLLGLILGYLFEKYQSLWVPIIIHAVYNGTSTLIGTLIPDASILLLGIVGLIGSLGMAYVMKSQYNAEDYIVEVVEDLEQDEVVEEVIVE